MLSDDMMLILNKLYVSPEIACISRGLDVAELYTSCIDNHSLQTLAEISGYICTFNTSYI